MCASINAPSGCPFGPSGYEGPNTSFSNINAGHTGGTVGFTSPLAPGGTAYFSLEESLSASQVFTGGPQLLEQGGAPNPSEHVVTCFRADPINCATGQLIETVTDVAVPGRGVPLRLDRTYTSGAASADGPLGHGWSYSYGMSLAVDSSTGSVTVTQENGSQIVFTAVGGGAFLAPPRVLATLTKTSTGYALTRKQSNVRFDFTETGQLSDEVDRHGYATVLTYAGGQLATVTDPAGRTITLAWSGNHLAGVTDPVGHATAYSYSAAGDLTGVKDPLGRTTSYGYDTGHQLVTVTDPAARTVTNTYDGSGRVTAQVGRTGLRTTFAYTGDPASTAGSTTAITDPHGTVTQHTYSQLELTSVTAAAGTGEAATTTYVYDPATLGQATVTDPLGRITTNTFDVDGNLLTTTDPLGHRTSFTYNGFDQLTSRTTPSGATTMWSYNSTGDPGQVTDPLGNVVVIAYGDAGHPGDATAVTDPDGRVTALKYDTAGDLAAQSSSPSAGVTLTTEYGHDVVGRLVCRSAPSAVASGKHCPTSGVAPAGTSTWTYDLAGQLTAITEPTGGTVTYAHDAAGNRTSVKDQLGRTTSTTYDGDHRPLNVTLGGGGANSSTTYAYDLAPGATGCQATVAGATYCGTTTDPNGHLTATYFGARDEMLAQVGPGTRTSTVTYDLAGQLLTRKDPAGRTATRSYDPAGRPTGISYSDGTTPAVGYTYDVDGRRTQLTDGTGTSVYAYDSDGRPTSVTNGAGAAVGYGYDRSGHVVALTYPGAGTVTRTYDGAARMVSVTDWASRTTTFGYDADGNVRTTTYPNGVTVTSQYDAGDRMIGASVGGASPIAALTWTRDGSGQVTQQSGTGALAGTTTYSYNPLDRLTGVGSTTYGYDATGNPTTLAGNVTQAFDAQDQLTTSTASGGNTTYGYDLVGDRTSTTAPSGSATAFSYDQESRLTSVTVTQPDPVVTAVSPASGPTAGGTTVTVTGSGFIGVISVTVGGKAATFTGSSGTTLSVTTPAGTGTADVVVTTAAGTSTISPGDRFTYQNVNLPAVSGLTPAYGPARGRTRVRISGSNFTGATAVLFGTTKARFRVTSPTLIEADSPGGRGSVDVTVVTPKGTSVVVAADTFTYKIGPGVYGISPDHGDESGGTVVVITGFGLDDATRVLFGTRRGTVRRSDDDRLVAESPPGAGTVDVRIVARTGTSDIVATDQFTYTHSRRGHDVHGRALARPTTVTGSRVSAKALTTTVATYTYDGDGLRTSKTVGGTTTLFAWDRSAGVSRALSDGTTVYVYGPTGAVIEEQTGASAPLFAITDQLGSTRALLDTTGAPSATFTYDAYGALIAHTGAVTGGPLFAGGYRDAETGLSYLVNRYYDPATTVFLTVDPIVDVTAQSYVYAGANPVNYVDPDGLFFNLVTTVVGAVAGGLAGAAVKGVSCAIDGDCTVGRVVAAGAVGAAGGACIGFTAGLGLQACGAAAARVGEALDESLRGEAPDPVAIGEATLLGAIPWPNITIASEAGRPATRLINLIHPGTRTLKVATNQLFSNVIVGSVNEVAQGMLASAPDC